MGVEKLIIIGPGGVRYKLVPESSAIVAPRKNPSNSLRGPRREDESFGPIFKRRREQASISQSAIAAEANIKQPNVANIESGKRTARIATRQKLIQAFEKLTNSKW